MDVVEILKTLEALGSDKVIKTKQKFGIHAKDSFGVFLKDLKVLSKKIPKDDLLAKALFDTGVYEARLLVPMIFNPENLTKRLMDQWVDTFNTWEICDTYCMGFFGRSPYVYEKAIKWVKKQGEYQRRAGFVCMVSYAFTNKFSKNEEYQPFFSEIIRYSNDDRHYVKKGVNWALRQIGKRNKDLYQEVIQIAEQLSLSESGSGRWIGKDALSQLQRDNVAMKNYPILKGEK